MKEAKMDTAKQACQQQIFKKITPYDIIKEKDRMVITCSTLKCGKRL
jgi:hypothetical protein